MSTITKTIRISHSHEKFLLKNFENVNQGINKCIESYQLKNDRAEILLLLSKKEVQEIFDSQDIALLTQALAGYIPNGVLRGSAISLIASIEVAEDLKKIKIGKSLKEKLSRLTAAQVDAVYSIIEDDN